MDLILNEVFIGATVYLVLTLVFTSQFIKNEFRQVYKLIEEMKRAADSRDDENEAYIRRLEVILQVYLQAKGLPLPYDPIQTEIKKPTDLG